MDDKELEANLIEQDHRLIPVVLNFFHRKTRWPDARDPRRLAAMKALAWRLLAPDMVVIGGGSIVGAITAFLMYQQTEAIQQQNRDFQERWYFERKTELIGTLYNTTKDGTNEVPLANARTRSEAFREFVKLETERHGTNAVIDLYGAKLAEVSSTYLHTNQATLLLAEADLRQATLILARFAEAELTGATLTGANLSKANLTGANLTGTDLNGANLNRALLSRSTLTGANLSKADLTGANFTEAYLKKAFLSAANLDNAILTKAQLPLADLTKTSAIRAKLFQANLNQANLIGSELEEANLYNANLTGADLTGANLYKARLSAADISAADLTGANLEEAELEEANLSGTDLSSAKNLTTDQITFAYWDEKTKWPEGFTPPSKSRLPSQ